MLYFLPRGHNVRQKMKTLWLHTVVYLVRWCAVQQQENSRQWAYNIATFSVVFCYSVICFTNRLQFVWLLNLDLQSIVIYFEWSSLQRRPSPFGQHCNNYKHHTHRTSSMLSGVLVACIVSVEGPWTQNIRRSLITVYSVSQRRKFPLLSSARIIAATFHLWTAGARWA